MTRVLFVCLGNICRSPMAQGVFRAMAAADGVAVETDSAGTSDYHAGDPPDPRAQAAMRARGFDISDLRARRVSRADFTRFDYILAMDEMNLGDLRELAPPDFPGVVRLFLDYAPGAGAREVPDPYFGGDEGFADVYALIDRASRGLLEEIKARAAPAPQLRE
ncbi:MAG: low molecular weight protein-tyrosine-phosphatase [Hyphomicrobiales bacterium]|nr:low molecular weight protein-tyrosine-phosphatase [Hyphomicrobiales bacterium]